MASLKDMRVRIAATKATQKITKAMQMVAASKLRRAQAAAEAARPYAERMEQSARLDRRGGCWQRFGATAAGRHRQRQGPSAGGLHRRARALRPVQLVDRAPGARKGECAHRRRQRGQDSLRRPQGLRPAAPAIRQAQIIETIELRGVRSIGFEQADRSPTRSSSCSSRASSTSATLFFSRFKSVIAQIPTAQQIIPPVFENAEARVRRPSMNTSRRRRKFSPSFCRAICRCRCSVRSWKTPRPSRARA